ncbi:hypothetical protein Tco_0395677, partial [Tanacetum coccineum]
ATHALVLEVARGFDYMKLDSDMSSEEPISVFPGLDLHINDIVQSVSIQDKPRQRRTFVCYLRKIYVKESIFYTKKGC